MLEQLEWQADYGQCTSQKHIFQISMSKIRYEQQQDAVKTIIERGCRCKEDASRHGLLDTPKRVAQAWRSMAAGDGSIEHASDIIKNALFFEPILTTSPHCGFVLVKAF